MSKEDLFAVIKNWEKRKRKEKQEISAFRNTKMLAKSAFSVYNSKES